ncbi:MAG TPA: DUF222 domain-containing protein [Lacisediminihabitans sp.]|uniref:DUF222 domain-containing protein n=1 Tax=Lacisediminihabitans sp. TaxID=2787631 RepID=UPI002ED9240B
MTDEGLEAVGTQLREAQRTLDTLRVTVAGEIAERSRSSLGGEGLAKRAGFARPSLLVAQLWGLGRGEATRLCDVGLSVRPRLALNGEPLPARFPAVADAIASRAMGIESAAVIVRELESAALRCSQEAREEGERYLVEWAPALTIDEMTRLARQMRDRLDQDGAEPRDELRRERRGFRLSTSSDGTVFIQWRLDPAEAGLVKAQVDGIVGRELRRMRAEDGPVADGPDERSLAEHRLAERSGPDEHTLEQLRSDAAMEIFRHTATCAGAAGELPSTKMVVRMSLESLLTGLGRAQIDGIDETISAGRARQLAAEAELIPMVLGAKGVVLDVGAGRRLFTAAQKLAFAERDGGCAWGGCTSPPSYAEAHHIEWWSTSPNSDLANGILLCTHHHHQIHDHGWEVFVEDNVPYFLPPPRIDPSRTPRRGGRIDLSTMPPP